MTREVGRVIGVMGGMGPEATLAFFGSLLTLTPADRDQDHLRVIIDSNPAIPDRSAAVLSGGPSPVPMMAGSIAGLERAGADFVVIPCVSAHMFVDELKEHIKLPLLSILDVVADQISSDRRAIRRVGLLATSGTVKAGLFQRRLMVAGVDVILPDLQDQEAVMSAIYAVKAGGERGQAANALRLVAHRLVQRGAQGIVLGCTEIPLVFDAKGLAIPVFDSLMILARAAVRAAGREPLAAPSVDGGYAA